MFLIQRKNMFVKILLSSLSILLCLLLIFNLGIVHCLAFAGTAEALFALLVAIMGSCGITFATVDDAHQASDTLYNNFSSDIQENLNAKAGQLAIAGAFTSAGVTFLADQWTMITQGIIETFCSYTGVDAVLPVANAHKLSLDNRTFSFPISCNLSSSVIYQFADSSLTLVGSKCTDYVFDSNVQDFLSNYDYRPAFVLVLNIANTFYYISSVNNMSDYVGTYNIELRTFQNSNRLYDIYFVSHGAVGSFNYFLNQKIHFSDISTSSFRILDANNQNIVQNNHLANTNIAVSDSICSGGLWDRVGWTNWLNDLIFGDSSSSALGNPSIDTTAYPGNDTWHDGSINDDVGISSGSIGIAVPGDISDVVDYSPDVARDISSTDVSIDTDVNPDVKPNVKPSSPDKVLPPLSLPEVLFKEKFPFCLPWDIYSLFANLQAKPECPKFEISFELKRFGIDESIVIDLSLFEEQIKIVRFFIGLGFTLVLIFVSRKMIGAE
ncbi:MAG: hypothetical protein UIM53_00315 [Acutalibacteraceae bacterium]|nr:hypothetical protein [Acutalibacteraceae bacterium]